MNIKNRLLFIFWEGAASILMITANPVWGAIPKAVVPPDAQNPTGINSPITQASQFWFILKSILQWTYTIFFIAAIIFILIAAFTFLKSKGEPEKVKSARNQIMWAVVAIAIALISVGANQIVQSFISPAGSGPQGQQFGPNEYQP